MTRKTMLLIVLLALSTSIVGPVSAQGDPLVEWVHAINEELLSEGLNIQINAIEFFTIGRRRPDVRILQQEARWVPNDTRRLAQGDDLTYLVDQSDGATASGLTSAQTEAAIDRAMAFHENGHSVGLGHFGPPPTAVMNPVYAGIVTQPYPTDLAGTCTLYAQWPRR